MKIYYLNKKAPDLTEPSLNQTDIIIAGKTYSVNELNALFNYNSLKNCYDKETLIKYWYLAIESGKKEYINIVSSVFHKNLPKYE